MPVLVHGFPSSVCWVSATFQPIFPFFFILAFTWCGVSDFPLTGRVQRNIWSFLYFMMVILYTALQCLHNDDVSVPAVTSVKLCPGSFVSYGRVNLMKWVRLYMIFMRGFQKFMHTSFYSSYVRSRDFYGKFLEKLCTR